MRLIDADAFKAEGRELYRHVGWGLRDVHYSQMDVECNIDNMPTIEAEPRWIPVTEKMPEENEAVNVTWVNHLPENYYKSIKDKPFTATAVFYRGDWYWWSDTLQDYLAEYGYCPIHRMDRAIEVIAWMPLPEPYKGVGE